MRARGFTLMEIMAVMAIIGVLLLAVVPNIDNQVPAFRLRGGARAVASTIELAQSEAISKRKVYAIRYDFNRNSYTLLLPPPDPEEEEESEEELADDMLGGQEGERPRDDVEHGEPPPDPNAPQDEEEEEELDDEELEALTETFLPDDVIFSTIRTGENSESGGQVVVRFSHLGNDGAHTVGLTLRSEQSDGGEVIYVKFNPLTRTLEYRESEPEMRTLQPEDGQ